eukprot:TRINITY_DN79_c0_g1_i1.p1 TRINITY_DN79_c0_g1~~TRINITY_DN79_c0_g1_i1.p1  ORF type:complete len:138 (+),score=19.70 TRINITY_DN79_c0_g1_i1:69-482(+)
MNYIYPIILILIHIILHINCNNDNYKIDNSTLYYNDNITYNSPGKTPSDDSINFGLFFYLFIASWVVWVFTLCCCLAITLLFIAYILKHRKLYKKIPQIQKFLSASKEEQENYINVIENETSENYNTFKNAFGITED